MFTSVGLSLLRSLEWMQMVSIPFRGSRKTYSITIYLSRIYILNVRQSDAYLAIVPKIVKNLRPSEVKIERSSIEIVESSEVSSASIPLSISS